MEKFFINTSQIINNNIIIKNEDAKHIAKVLRKKVNDEIYVTDEEKNTYLCKIILFEDHDVVCEISGKLNINTESNIDITLFQCIAKYDKMDYIFQKATEIGVKQIYPVVSNRVVVKLDDKTMTKKVDRWNKIVYEASKQSQRTIIPNVENIIFLKDICNLCTNYDIILLAYEQDNTNLKEILKKCKKNEFKNIGIIIGPEGGFDISEVELLKCDKIVPVSLGKRILRTETASLALLSNIFYELEDI